MSNPGSVIAVGALGVWVGLLAYGFSQDVIRWWEDAMWRRDEREWDRRLDRLEEQWLLPDAPNPRLRQVNGSHERRLGERRDWA